MAGTLDEHQFLCSVCLDLFTDPVLTLCGHNFCKLCIETYWDTTEVGCCPLCKEVFYKRPELRINTAFREVVNHFKNTTAGRMKSGNGCEAKVGEVACDICTDVKLKATKSCLVCMVSYCEIHLEPHKTAAALSKHKLIEPVRDLEERVCKKHEKILELFCKKEEKFICQICAETDHSRHLVVKAEVAVQQKMIQIKRRGREVELMIQNRKRRTEELIHSSKQTNENAQKQMEASVQVFKSVMESMERTQKELMDEIKERCAAEQQRFEELIKELKKEIKELEKKSNELQQLSQSQDYISIMQAFSQAYTLPSTQDWPSIPVNEVDFWGYIHTSLVSAREFINMEIREQVAADFKAVQKFADDIIINAETAGLWLIVSEDGKEVRQSSKKQKVPNSLTRFTENTFAVATQGLTTGRHYWEVGVKEKSNWMLGVASGSLMRRQQMTPSPENGLWTVSHREGEQYFALMQKPFPLLLSPPPQRVGVFVDYEEKQVSFFNAEANTHIFTFAKCNFRGKVYPIFDPCLAIEKKEVAPLRIMRADVMK